MVREPHLDEDADPRQMRMLMRIWTKQLQEILSMRRLQALEQLTLNFSLTDQEVAWQDCLRFLQMIIKNSPTVRKLSLESLHLADPLPPTKVLAEQLVAKLVNFEQVDFGTDGFLHDHHWDVGDNSVANAILRRLAAVASSGQDSKLQVLSKPNYYCHSDLIIIIQIFFII